MLAPQQPLPGDTLFFLQTLFSLVDDSNGDCEFRSCANAAGGESRSLMTRDPENLAAFLERHDVSGRGVYVGISSRRRGAARGRREDCSEVPALWLDIDTRKLGIAREAACEALTFSALPPSVVVDSGNGVHAYWVLTEPMCVDTEADDGRDNEQRILAVLRQLAGVFAGDFSVCDIARIMRLPGSHNSKDMAMLANDGLPIECRILSIEASKRYDITQLEDWLEVQRPLLARPASDKPQRSLAGDDDAFQRYTQGTTVRVPVDVTRDLASMAYGADGDAGIHRTQLRVSGHMVAKGADDETIMRVLMSATIAAAGHAGMAWNWRREEQNIKRMIDGARARGYDVTAAPARSKGVPAAAAAAGGGVVADDGAMAAGGRAAPHLAVVPISEARAKKARADAAAGPKPRLAPVAQPVADEQGHAETETARDGEVRAHGEAREARSDIEEVANAVHAKWLAERGPLYVVDGEFWGYEKGVWRIFDDGMEHQLRVEAQGMTCALQKKPTPTFKNSVYEFLHEAPGLARKLEFGRMGYVACDDAAINVDTGEIRPHHPDLACTIHVPCTIKEATGITRWLAHLNGIFEDREEGERVLAVQLIQEWMGAALVRAKSKALTRALILYGLANTGKTRVANIVCHLMGGEGHVSAISLGHLNTPFGTAELVGKTAWIRDDGISEGDNLQAEVFKTVVSGERLAIRRKYKTDIHWRPDMPILLTANTLPTIKDPSNAVYLRLLLVPLSVVRVDGKGGNATASDALDKALHVELSGILLWAIEGWKRLKERGAYEIPEFVAASTAEYKAENTPVATFLRECIEPDEESYVHRRDVLAALNAWLDEQNGTSGVRRMGVGGRLLSKTMRLTYPHIRPDWASNGQRYMRGARLSPEGLAAWGTMLKLDAARCHAGSVECVNRVLRTRM